MNARNGNGYDMIVAYITLFFGKLLCCPVLKREEMQLNGSWAR